MISKDKICAIIVSYNIGKRIINCVNAIINQVHQIIIVDNDSNESTIKELIKLQTGEKVKVIYNDDNYGIAKALNIGINEALNKGYDWVLTLDHDSIASKNMVNKIAETYKLVLDKNSIGIICANLYDVNKRGYLVKDNDFKKSYKVLKVAIQSGSLIRIKVFKEIGLFNEDLFIYYVDVEFSERLKKHSYKIIQSNPAILYHEEGKKIKKKLFGKEYYYDNYSEMAVYYIARNSIYMVKNYKENKKSYMKRLKSDFKNILMFDDNKFVKLKCFFWGVYNGINNKYGKFKC